MYFTSPVKVDGATMTAKVRKPFEMPKAGEDQLYEYVASVKPDAPFEYCTIGGLDFQKRVYPPEKSLVKNQNKTFEAGVKIVLLTEKQAEALKKRAKEHIMKIGTRNNEDWKPGKDEEPEFLPAFEVNASDFIVLEKKTEFDFAKHIINDVTQEPQVDESEKLEKTIYNMQKKGKKK